MDTLPPELHALLTSDDPAQRWQGQSVALSANIVTPLAPRTCGARCHECPLAPGGPLAREDWKPVPAEDHGAAILAVVEAPGKDETRTGRPLMGRAGQEWSAALESMGLNRSQIDLEHVVACQPPGNPGGAWKRMTVKLDRMNKDALARGEKVWKHPEECCRPRLLHTTSAYDFIFTLGKVATTALTGQSRSMRNMRGDLMMVDKDYRRTSDEAQLDRKVVPMMHPSFITRSPSWRNSLRADIGKGLRWFGNNLRWADPDAIYQPSPQELRDFLAQAAPFWVYDLETDGIRVETTQIRTIGIAIPDLTADGVAARHGDEVAQVSRVIVLNLLSGNTLRSNPPNPWNPHGKPPPGRFYAPEDEELILAILKGALTDGRRWYGQNAGSFDRQVVEAQWGFTPRNVHDTLFGSRFRAPDLPKSLKTVGSLLLDVERWETTEKGDKIATGFDDDARAVYCGLDCVVNARIVPYLNEATEKAGAFRPLPPALMPPKWVDIRPLRGVKERKDWTLYEVDHLTQEMCVGMHKNGVYVDQERRAELEKHYEASAAQRKERLSSLFGFVDLDDDPEAVREAVTENEGETAAAALNPNAYGQIRDLLYDVWKLGCPPSMDMREFYTDTGLPGTGDAVLRAHLASGNLTEEQADFIQELRLYRREKNKILGTTLLPLSRGHKKDFLRWDGRVRPSWNAHVTSVGRLSCSGPNLQNIGGRKGMGALKSIFSAAPGNYLIGSDLDQAHLVIIANIWRIPILREAFLAGKDPHSTLAYAIFGNAFKNAEGWAKIGGFTLKKKPPKGSKALAMREIAKTFRYASIYWAKPGTIWGVITSTETGGAVDEYLLTVKQRLKARLPYYDFSKADIYLFHKKWLKAEPEWVEAWMNCLDLYKLQGFMEEPVLGRRSGGLSDGKKNEVVNFPVLAAEGSVMRLAEAAIMSAFPFRGPNGPGMIHQCHDSATVEQRMPRGFDLKGYVKAKKVAARTGRPMPELPPQMERARREVEEAMCVKIPGWDIPVSAEAEVGYTLADV